MAGHENSLVRPRTSQDVLKIAAGSPLAIQGIFLEIIRERFREDAGLGTVWRPDLTETDIVIEVGYNDELESRSQAPAVYVNRVQTVPGKVVIGDRAGVRLRDHKEAFGAITSVTLQIDVVSNDEGESAILADIIQFMLLASQDVIQREFGLYDMTHPSLGQTVPYSRDQNKWNTPVEFYVQFWIRWAQVPIAPLLQQIVQRVSTDGVDATGHFQDIAVHSLRRADLYIPDSVPGEALPPSRITIVGPRGAEGPRGPAGPPGPPSSGTATLRFSFVGESTGTIPSVVGAVYLDGGFSLSAISSVFAGVIGAGTITVRLIAQDTSLVLASWSSTSPPGEMTLGSVIPVPAAGWYVFDIAGSTPTTVVRCYGARLEP